MSKKECSTDENGNIIGIVMNVENVTERVQFGEEGEGVFHHRWPDRCV